MAVQTVKVTIDGQVHNLSYNSQSGKWEAVITAPNKTSYHEQNHKFDVTVTASDQAGNVTTKNRTDSVLGSDLQLRVLEKDKPIISLTSPSSGARITNASPNIVFHVRDSSSGIDISTLQLKIDAGTAKTNTSSGMSCTSVTGGYNCTYTPSALSEGAHTITISVKDNDGNLSNLLSSTFTVDTAPPMLNITNPSEGLITNSENLTVSGTTNDVTSSPVTISIKLNGVNQGAVNVSGGNFSKSIVLNKQGNNVIEVIAKDTAGLQTKITRNIVFDTIAPTISTVTVSPNPVDEGKTFTITVTVSD
ncbi:Ig-like domain-containing protein [Crassaminicella profunda]|uniref:Ig-like domain-containing protein n=1 Tax=Crassaminicella profunda TaxID=1286698 RepID=UPI001CA69858|nr:Ig-like domain-containing protein [Crassaminicella profunda]QZY56720.1 hypothetical protein K7H06_07305 [Crassaminicella profunda]